MECVVQGMATDRNIERTFWLDVIVETIREQPESEREQRFLYAARLIEASPDAIRAVESSVSRSGCRSCR